jgi:hypothetical protein
MKALASPAASFLPGIPSPSQLARAPPRSAAAALSRPPSGRSIAAAAAAATGDHWGADHQHYHGGRAGASSEAGPTASARGVKCDVDVVSWRERRVLASVPVAADVDTLWQVITDYERLADFIPNLVQRSAFSRLHLSRLNRDCSHGCLLKVSDWGGFARASLAV